MDALVAAMTAKEDSNFRLFSYVGDVNSEAEKLQAHADEVQKELDRYQAATDAQDAERQAKLQVTSRPPPPLLTWIASTAAYSFQDTTSQSHARAAHPALPVLRQRVAGSRRAPGSAAAAGAEVLGEGAASVWQRFLRNTSRRPLM